MGNIAKGLRMADVLLALYAMFSTTWICYFFMVAGGGGAEPLSILVGGHKANSYCYTSSQSLHVLLVHYFYNKYTQM